MSLLTLCKQGMVIRDGACLSLSLPNVPVDGGGQAYSQPEPGLCHSLSTQLGKFLLLSMCTWTFSSVSKMEIMTIGRPGVVTELKPPFVNCFGPVLQPSFLHPSQECDSPWAFKQLLVLTSFVLRSLNASWFLMQSWVAHHVEWCAHREPPSAVPEPKLHGYFEFILKSRWFKDYETLKMHAFYWN